MSTERLVFSLFIYAQLLPLLSLLHLLSLYAIEIWTGIHLALTIQGPGINIEDDICLPHPTGMFYPCVIAKIATRIRDHEATFDPNLYVCNAFSSDCSILSVAQDITFAVPPTFCSWKPTLAVT